MNILTLFIQIYIDALNIHWIGVFAADNIDSQIILPVDLLECILQLGVPVQGEIVVNSNISMINSRPCKHFVELVSATDSL